MNHWLELLLAASLMAFTGCNVDVASRMESRSDSVGVIAEGTVFSVTYQQTEGKSTTITRASSPPDTGGTWNVDAYGKLTSQALVLTYPGRREFGPHVIPFERIIEIQFGDGGIQNPGLGSAARTGEHGQAEHPTNEDKDR